MLTFILTQIFSFMSSGLVSLLTNLVDRKTETKIEELKQNTQVRLAEISAENNRYTQENNIKTVEAKLDADSEERIIKLERLLKKSTGNKYIDFVNSTIRPFIAYYIIGIWMPTLCISYYYIDAKEVFFFGSTIITSITAFFFVGRVFTKKNRI